MLALVAERYPEQAILLPAVRTKVVAPEEGALKEKKQLPLDGEAFRKENQDQRRSRVALAS